MSLIDIFLWKWRKSINRKPVLRKSNLLLLYQWNSTVKVSWQLIARETLQYYFLSNVSIHILGSCKFQLYVKFYSATISLGSCKFRLYVKFFSVTISLHNRLLLSHFYINILKIGITSSSKLSKTLSQFK